MRLPVPELLFFGMAKRKVAAPAQEARANGEVGPKGERQDARSEREAPGQRFPSVPGRKVREPWPGTSKSGRTSCAHHSVATCSVPEPDAVLVRAHRGAADGHHQRTPFGDVDGVSASLACSYLISS